MSVGFVIFHVGKVEVLGYGVILLCIFVIGGIFWGEVGGFGSCCLVCFSMCGHFHRLFVVILFYF